MTFLEWCILHFSDPGYSKVFVDFVPSHELGLTSGNRVLSKHFSQGPFLLIDWVFPLLFYPCAPYYLYMSTLSLIHLEICFVFCWSRILQTVILCAPFDRKSLKITESVFFTLPKQYVKIEFHNSIQRLSF